MNIEINEDQIKGALEGALRVASERVGQDLTIRESLREMLLPAVQDVMSGAIRQAVEKVDVGAMRDGIAEELARTLATTVHYILRGAAVAVVSRLSAPQYETSTEHSARTARLEASMFGKP